MNSVLSDYQSWMQSRGYLAPASVSAYVSDLSQFEVWLMDYRRGVRWSMVSKSDIEDYLQFLVSKSIEFSSVNRCLSAISSLYRYFVNRKMMNVNPCEGVKRLRPTYHQREALSMDIVRQVLAQPNIPDSTRALIALIAESGLRIGECMALRMEDIDFESHQIRVLGKGRAYRIAFYGPTAAKYLEEYVCHRSFSGSIFPESRRQYNWDIYHACKPFAGAHKCSPHILRHTFATECLSQGMPMDVLMLTLGHKSIDTTMLYTHCQSSRVSQINSKCAARIG